MKAKASQAELVRKMNERDSLLKKMLSDAQEKLRQFASSPQYKDLCKRLIVQGLVKLMEEKVKIKCRQADKALVQGVLEEAKADYIALMKKECGKDVNVALRIDDKNFLSATSAGGVICLGANNRIVCDNTLDSRLKIAFGDLKPVVRSMLFQ
jgi:V-type H+-transporting ATPase subunit E